MLKVVLIKLKFFYHAVISELFFLHFVICFDIMFAMLCCVEFDERI